MASAQPAAASLTVGTSDELTIPFGVCLKPDTLDSLLSVWVYSERSRALGEYCFRDPTIEDALTKLDIGAKWHSQRYTDAWNALSQDERVLLIGRLKWFRSGMLCNLFANELKLHVVSGFITLSELMMVRDCWRWNGMSMGGHTQRFTRRRVGEEAAHELDCIADIAEMPPLIIVAHRPFFEMAIVGMAFLLEGYHRARALIRNPQATRAITSGIPVIVIVADNLELWERWNFAMSA